MMSESIANPPPGFINEKAQKPHDHQRFSDNFDRIFRKKETEQAKLDHFLQNVCIHDCDKCKIEYCLSGLKFPDKKV